MIERRSLLALFGLAPFVPLNLLPTASKPEAPAIKYRTDGKWGASVGRELYATDVDQNFYALSQRILALEEKRG